MPITVTIAEGLLTPAGEKDVLPRLSALLLDVHGLTGNTFMTPIVVGSVNVLAASHIFSGGRPQSVAFVELKVPSSTFTTQAIRSAFVAQATNILIELSGGMLAKEFIFVNILYAIDGSWGVAGHAYTNAEISESIGQASD